MNTSTTEMTYTAFEPHIHCEGSGLKLYPFQAIAPPETIH